MVENAGGKWDLGGVALTDSGSSAIAIGDAFHIEDDGPTVSSNTDVQLDDETETGGIDGGTGDVDPDTANTTGTLMHDFGADGGSIEWLDTGTPPDTSFTYVKDGGNLLIKQDGTTVITVTLVPATGFPFRDREPRSR